MQPFDPEQTVAALATPPGNGALGVIRISGKDSFRVGEKLFKGKKRLTEMTGYEAAYGHLYTLEGKKLDEVVALKFVAPKSYTGEDSLEFYCHGGSAVISSVLTECYKAGARPASAGEFTRRALMNGKISLTQAEGIAALVSAENRQAADLALAQREGRLSKELEEICDLLTDLKAHLAALIDFPEEDVPMMDCDAMAERLLPLQNRLRALLDTYDSGQMIRYGIKTALLGPPNAGKSSLMNRLCGEKKSIVTPIPGTTRDLVEAHIRLDDLQLQLFDTAGLTETDDPVEAMGVSLALEKLEQAQLILLVLEAGGEMLPEKWLSLAEQKPTLLLWNKTDASLAEVPKELAKRFPLQQKISALTGEGMSELSLRIKEAVKLHNLSSAQAVLLNDRQRDGAYRALTAVEETHTLLSETGNFDLAGVMLDAALEEIYALSGKRADDAVIDRVFETFCVGK